MTTIYLMRHANSIYLDNITNEKFPLSEIGRKQAEEFSKKVSNFDICFSSKYDRAISTAKYFSDNIIITDKLNERKIGDLSNAPKTSWTIQLEDENFKLPGGENRKEVTERMVSFFNEVLEKYKDKKILMVSHGAAITFFLMNYCKLEDVDLETKRRHLTFNGKTVINDTIKNLDIFKLIFDDKKLINIELIRL